MTDGKVADSKSIPQLFVSYTRVDADYCAEFCKHCSVLVDSGLVDLWYDEMLAPGADWEKEINTRLVKSDIIVLLISADYISSEFIRSVEMPLALRRHADPTDDVAVVPVLIRNFLYEVHDLSKLNILPKDENRRLRPVNRWGEFKDDAWTQVVQRIYNLLSKGQKDG